jgi:hypothetical protein
MTSDGKTRLARWAQRKAAASRRRGGAAPAIAEVPAVVPDTACAPVDKTKSELEEAGRPTSELDLPDVESLTAGSDFTAFMKDGVPAELRRLALRKLWASDPMFNVIDEMVEYGEDYTDAAMVVEGMKSAWEAGRGYATKTVEDDKDDNDDNDNKADKEVPDDSQEQQAVAGEQISSDEQPTKDETKEHG